MSDRDQDRGRGEAIVGARLIEAAWREGLGHLGTGVVHHGFDRVEVTGPVTEPPAVLLRRLGIHTPALTAELDDAVANLDHAYRRRTAIDDLWRARAAERGSRDAYGVALGERADDQAIAFERLATDGHNLHPCGRTRLGWTRADVERYDQEADPFDLAFVAIRDDAHLGDDIGRALRLYREVPAPPDGYVLQPVHPWQLESVLRTRHADLFATGVLREMPGIRLRAAPTTALRTVLLGPDRYGARHYLKLSLDIQVTSTRRSISIASTRNGPVLTALVEMLLRNDPRTILMPEPAGAAIAPGRDIAAILRGQIDPDRLAPGDVAIPGSALPAVSPITGRTILAEVVDRFGAAQGSASPALKFMEEYGRLLLTPILRLLDRGIGLEAHLQNSIPVFHDGVPVRMVFRDLAGMRLHLPRLAAHTSVRLWPGSVIGTEDIDVARAKAGYTALQAHLGELILRLTGSHGLDEDRAWRTIRAVIDDIYATERLDAGDHAFFVAPTMPHKALVRMRLSEGGDIYRPVRNPLHDS